MITIAVAKGYLLSESVTLFQRLGFQFEDDFATTRKLFIEDTSRAIRLLIVRPWDVPVYVEYGAADLGIVGKDVLLEQSPQVLTLLDLKFGACDLVIAGPTPMSADALTHHMTVSTKYPNATQRFFDSLGLSVHLIKLYGAIELAPITGVSDLISDLTASGRTLKENGLHVISTVFSSTAFLIANPISMRAHYEQLVSLTSRLKEQVS